VRRSEYTQLADHVFGRTLATTFTQELSLARLDHRTPAQAIAQGEDVRAVWTALCDEMDVPESQRWEVPPELRRR
jgi:hypothetical protein